jgi:hypothetical protein
MDDKQYILFFNNNAGYIDVLRGLDYKSVLITFTCSSTLHVDTCHNRNEG